MIKTETVTFTTCICDMCESQIGGMLSENRAYLFSGEKLASPYHLCRNCYDNLEKALDFISRCTGKDKADLPALFFHGEIEIKRSNVVE